MVFVKATEDEETNAPAMAEAFAARDGLTEELVAAGVFVAAAGLKNTGYLRNVCYGQQQETFA